MEDPTKIEYVYNDCDVIINPYSLWKYKPSKSLAWLYWEIKIGCCKNGLWDFGFWTVGGCSPCSNGTYETYEIAKEKAIEKFKKYFSKFEKGLCNEKFFNEGKESFNNFIYKEQFNHNDMILENFDLRGNDYIQTSLF